MQEREKNEFYLTVKGQKTVVSEEVYRAYVRPIRAEQQKRKRERRCILKKVGNRKIVQFRCKDKCSACEKYFEGNKNIGIATSFDELVSNGFDIQDITINIEKDFLRNDNFFHFSGIPPYFILPFGRGKVAQVETHLICKFCCNGQ